MEDEVENLWREEGRHCRSLCFDRLLLSPAILHHHSLFTLALVSVPVAGSNTHPGWDHIDQAETNTAQELAHKGIPWNRGHDEEVQGIKVKPLV